MERSVTPIDLGEAASRVLARLKHQPEKPSDADAEGHAHDDKKHVVHEVFPC